MKIVNHLLLSALLILPIIALGQVEESSTLTKIGDNIPSFSFEIEKGKTVKIEDYNGRLILINLFATWCPPCNEELPHVQEEIWKKHGSNPKFALFVFGREEGWAKLDSFKTKKKFTFPILPDVDRSIFSKFATKYIPRNIVIDGKGKIIYQSTGNAPNDFAAMVKLIDDYLEKVH